MSALEEIRKLAQQADPYRCAPDNLAELQWEALKQRFASMRESVRVLERRCADAGVGELRTPADVVPALFAHQVYKSYPDALIERGRWQHMTTWLQSLSASPVEGVDLDGISDVDDWIGRLRARDHHVGSSSGTSGKSSFMNHSAGDERANLETVTTSILVGGDMHDRSGERPYFVFLTRNGSYRPVAAISGAAEAIGKPGHVHYLFDEPMLAQPAIAMGRMRRAIAEGKALPEQIRAFQDMAERRQEETRASIARFVDTLLEYQGQPVVLHGMWPMFWQVVELARARGVKERAFGDGVHLVVGGGIKGAKLPPDYKEQILNFFGITEAQVVLLYGMSEVTGTCPWSHADSGYAVPPWLVPFVLSKDGEHLLDPRDSAGIVEGRLGLVDLLMEGRWSGLISGDKVVVDFNRAGRDGYKVPLIRSVARYSDLEEGEDKLSCAGTLDSYVRGMIEV